MYNPSGIKILYDSSNNFVIVSNKFDDGLRIFQAGKPTLSFSLMLTSELIYHVLSTM